MSKFKEILKVCKDFGENTSILGTKENCQAKDKVPSTMGPNESQIPVQLGLGVSIKSLCCKWLPNV